MKTTALLRLGSVIWCAGTMMLIVPMVSLTELAAAAQREDSRKEAPENIKNSELKKPMSTTLTIEVLLVDPEKKQLRHPAQAATVKIQGDEESYPTDEDGKTRRLSISTGAKAIIIQPTGAKPCSVDVSVKEGNHTVTVLVENLTSVKCSLQPPV